MRQDFVQPPKFHRKSKRRVISMGGHLERLPGTSGQVRIQQRDADRVSFRISRSLGDYICNGPVAPGRQSRRLRAHRLYAAR